MEKRVEILAPAGSFESMKAAVAAGADAVYIGGSRFGARAFADNLDEEKMIEAIDYVHLHGRRLYLTVNTLVKEREMGELLPYLAPYCESGLDAVIVQDMGVLSAVREYFPDLPIHASTQMTVTGPRAAARLMAAGVSRIVTARELSLEEIKRIYDETDAEIESFVHGALCYSYSGQCLMSSLIGGRSGNRGRCAQTCRLPFEVKQADRTLNKKTEAYVLSLKDLCTLDILPDIIGAGVYSLKIEGRMKSPRYTAGVVSIYRKYVDLFLQKGRDAYRVEEEDRRALLDLFDRGGQTDGYYNRQNGREMAVLREKPAFRQENRTLNDYLDRNFVEAEVKEPVRGTVTVAEGARAELCLTCSGASVSVSGAMVQTAKSQPMTEERIRRQVGKTGKTPFYFEELTVNVSGLPFLPVQDLNELRRSGMEKLTKEILRPYRRAAVGTNPAVETGRMSGTDPAVGTNPAGETGRMSGTDPAVGMNRMSGTDPAGSRGETPGAESAVPAVAAQKPSFLTVSVEEPAQLTAALLEPAAGEIYLDSASFAAESWQETAARCHAAGKRCFLTLPHVFRSVSERYFSAHRPEFAAAGFDGVLVRDWSEIPLMREWAPKLLLVTDYGIYTMNRRAEETVRELAGPGPLRFTLPVELNSRELRERGGDGCELIVYGRIPVMVTAQCLTQTAGHCTQTPGELYLRDRMAKEFPVKNHCRFCYNTIYNCRPLSLIRERKEVDRLGPSALRLNFTTEEPKTVQAVIRAFAEAYLPDPVGGRDISAGFLTGEGYTKGHFKRGIE